MNIRSQDVSNKVLFLVLSLGIIFVTANSNFLVKVLAANPYQISNDQVKNTYRAYIKLKRTPYITVYVNHLESKHDSFQSFLDREKKK